MAEYVWLSFTVITAIFCGVFPIILYKKDGKVKCVECNKTIIPTYRITITCPFCSTTFAKRNGKVFRVVK